MIPSKQEQQPSSWLGYIGVDDVAASVSRSARAGEDAERTGMPKPFTFSWDELMTADPAAASKLYATVFGWDPEPMDMGGGMTYTLFQRPGVTNAKGEPVAAGGMMKSPPGVPVSSGLPSVMVPPQDIPGVGRFACWSDPQGASIAITQPPR